MTRKQRKKKWIISATLVVVASMIPAEASSPKLSDPGSTADQRLSKVCGREDLAKTTWGSCDAGLDCCSGFPEAPCDGWWAF
jgi:hypothetical protein